MRQSGYDFADLAEDLSQFDKGAVQRGSTHLHGDMVENISQAVQNLADQSAAIAQVWGYVCATYGPSCDPTTAHVIEAQARYDTVQVQLTCYVDPDISVTKVKRCCVHAAV